jgi:hypothetical protein
MDDHFIRLTEEKMYLNSVFILSTFIMFYRSEFVHVLRTQGMKF